MAAQKKLEPGSSYEHFDIDGDGVVSDEEFELEREMMRAMKAVSPREFY